TTDPYSLSLHDALPICPQTLELEDLSGLTVADATQRLADLGLRATVENRYHDEVPQGLVITTDPAPGSTVRVGDSVKLVVSNGRSEETRLNSSHVKNSY